MASNDTFMTKAEKLERTTDKLHAIVKEHLAQFSSEEQKRRWANLERYVSDADSEKRAKRQGRHAKRANRLRSPARATHR
jgi:hypothetical protein